MTPSEARLRWRKSSYSGGNGGNCIELAYDWRKSSHSGGNGGECVELAYAPGLIRDSKNPSGPRLKGNIEALVAAVKVDRLSRS